MRIGNSLRNTLETNPYKEFISIDVETTGLNPELDSIVQIGAIKFNLKGDVLDTYEHLFYPNRNYIPQEAIDVHGITMKDVEGYPTYKRSPSAIRSFCDGIPLVGHNITHFDIKFLDFDCVKTPAIFDTLVIAQETWKTRIRPSLANACKKIGIHEEGYHNALFDAKQSMRLFLYFYNMPEQLGLDLKKDAVVATVKTEIKYEARKLDLGESYILGLDKQEPYSHNGMFFIPFDSPIENHWWKKDAVDKVFSHTSIEKKKDKYGKEYEEKKDHYDTKKRYPDVKFKSFAEIEKP